MIHSFLGNFLSAEDLADAPDKVRVSDIRWGTISKGSQPHIQAKISSGFHSTKAQRDLWVECLWMECLWIGDNEKSLRVGLRPRMLFLFCLESEFR